MLVQTPISEKKQGGNFKTLEQDSIGKAITSPKNISYKKYPSNQT